MGKRQRRRNRERGSGPKVITEQGFDSAEWLSYGSPTYGGKPMEPILPSREEYIRAWNERHGDAQE